jgi:hypothetical protein
MTKKTFLKLKEMIISKDDEMSELGMTAFLKAAGARNHNVNNQIVRALMHLKFLTETDKELLKQINTHESDTRKDKKHDK